MAFATLTDGYLDSTEVARCFGADAVIAHMLEFEVQLAHVESELGIIPKSASARIGQIASELVFDVNALIAATAEASNPAIPFVTALTDGVAHSDREAARYVHWGSTSQDVMDSAAMLCCRAALDYLFGILRRTRDIIVALIEVHRATPMVARTLSQHAAPTTFGAKAAGWLVGIVAGEEKLRRLYPQLPLQFGGASGTLASFGPRGQDVAAGLAQKLGLLAVMPWHTQRSAIRELAAALADVAAAAGKIATDIVLMTQTEVDELRESAAPGRGGSSALPHKRNPVASIAVVAGGRRVAGSLATIYANFDHCHERAAGAWHAENMALRDIFVTSGAVIEQLHKALDGIEVDSVNMRRNLDLTGGVVMAEAIVLALAPVLGVQSAQALVKAALKHMREQRTTFAQALTVQPEAKAELDGATLARLLDPLNYLGVADDIMNQALSRAQRLDDL